MRFPANSDSCCPPPVRRSGWETSGASVSSRKIRRRHFSAHLHPAGCHLWLHHDHCRNGAGPDDPQKPGGRLQPFWQGEGLAFGGWINAVIPILIVPYYSVIGGWVIHYLAQYLTGHGSALASDGYFSGFISNGLLAEIPFLLFTFITLGIIFAGVRNGVERVSKVMMPVLVVLSVVIAVYSVTRPGALAGVKYFLVPNPANFSWMTVVSAMGQMFYSSPLPWASW